MGKHLTDNLRM